MKCTLSLCLLVVAVSTICVLALPPLGCTNINCETQSCPPIGNCACGNHTILCGCCHKCYKCPGESCRTLGVDSCSRGYECTVSSPTLFEALEVTGVCTAIATTPRSSG
ncbi:cysteine-rich motor neuron 1 protein [Ixodes scapularis]